MKNNIVKLSTEFADPLGGGALFSLKNNVLKHIKALKNTQNIYKLNTQLIT